MAQFFTGGPREREADPCVWMFDAWFPVQKGIANLMGDTLLSRRREGTLISIGQIAAMREVMEPGDIMVQRRNW